MESATAGRAAESVRMQAAAGSAGTLASPPGPVETYSARERGDTAISGSTHEQKDTDQKYCTVCILYSMHTRSNSCSKNMHLGGEEFSQQHCAVPT